ncbi:MAG TPA: RNA degradosome polyphosphate kinase [Candidatus Cryptobacteroides merdipullorum]|uniref:Polyphosphate kinase n=1 Tax=Candidatus Cryptobacteroides merdipullorum TaxID=2840771 RepID=A0A9D1KI13_9BACT|nr:RNA degradosome polyphosphate kinase [Candidatus Cryptobacteroides merdipullorum]
MPARKIKKTIERDVSWMYFNHRILQEAQRPEVPLLEKLNFIGIYSNNLDEFFRVRVATLSRIAENDHKFLRDEVAAAKKTLKRISKLYAEYDEEFTRTVDSVFAELSAAGIRLLEEDELDERQLAWAENFFEENLVGATSPIWMNKVDDLNLIADSAHYLAVSLARSEGDRTVSSYAVLPIPTGRVGRYHRLPDDADGNACVVALDDILRLMMGKFFVGLDFEKFEAYSFKFTRDAEMEIDNDFNESKMQKVQKGLASRRTGEPLRVMYDSEMPRELLRRVIRKLKLSPYDTIVPGRRYHNHKDLMSFPDCGRNDLKYPSRRPLDMLGSWRASMGETGRVPGIFEIISASDRFIHVPYHSFDAYLQLLREAAVSPKVKAVKISLYRLAKNSKVVEALIAAAHNGKRVTVVIELLARFDEESNIHWSAKMRDAGIEVIYGVEGLKVHGKLTHIKTTSGSYAVIGTGNFHEGNARSYTDVLLFTARPELVREVEKVFDFIASPFIPIKFRELLVAPNHMRGMLSRLIRTEIANARKGLPAYIRMKINHITDEDMIDLLYKASEAGVQVDIALRGNCSIITGQRGFSENIRICGIIDRYLEHSRILIFANGGQERIFLGSADWMPRNLDHRVEVLAPVYDPQIREELRRIVDSALADTVQARVVDGSGDNRIRTLADLPEYLDTSLPGHAVRSFRSQDELYRHYSEELKCTQQ